MFDLLISQHAVSWKSSLTDNGSLPSSFQFGSSVLSANILETLPDPKFDLQKHLNAFYQLFCEEIVVAIERVRFLYLKNSVGINLIDKEANWGVISNELKDLQSCVRHHF